MLLHKFKGFFLRRIFTNIRWGEFLLLLLIVGVVGGIAYHNVQFVGSEFDTLLYLNTAQYPQANASILNRYSHIYLQSLFLQIFPHPLDAVKGLWAFEIFGTAALVYLCAKLLRMRNDVFTGIVAVLFFLTQRKLYASAGAPLIEFTLAFFLCTGIFLYLLYINSQTRSHWLLFAMGILQILLLKTKEPGIIYFPLILAAIYTSGSNWRERLHSTIWPIAGLLAGALMFIALDTILLKDTFFSFRRESWQQLLQFNLTLVYSDRSPLSWYDVALSTTLAMPILLSILTIWNDTQEDFPWAKRLIWTLPILLIVFLSYTSFRAAFPQNFRYIYPLFALFAMTGAQFFSPNRKRRTLLMSILGLSAIFAVILYLLFYPYVASLPFRWTVENFFTNIMGSLLVSIILGAIIIPKSFKFQREWIVLPPLVVLLLTPILHIPSELAITRSRAENFSAPYDIYINQIRRPAGANIFYTSTPYENYTMLGRDSGSARNFFEAFFNVRSGTIGFSSDLIDLLQGDYDYAFVTRAEMQSASFEDDIEAAGYIIHDNPQSEVILLSRE